jgi:SAM-dependent methyltransferase
MNHRDQPPSVYVDGQRFDLRYPIPKIKTQKESRFFGIYWSDELGYGVLRPEPTATELEAFYNIDSYSDYLSGKAAPTTTKLSIVNRVIIKLAYLADRGIDNPIPSILALCKKPPSVCEIGCGSGAFLERIRPHAATTVGIDPSEVSGNAVSNRGIEFHRGTAEDPPDAIKGREFDLVTMFQSLEHCRDPERAVANAKALLKKDGLLVIDVPNMECLGFKLYRQVWWHTDAGRHLAFFSTRSLIKLFNGADLNAIKLEYASFTRQFTPDWVSAMTRGWDQVFSSISLKNKPPRPSMLLSFAYLPVALFCPSRMKYDIVRVYGRRRY